VTQILKRHPETPILADLRTGSAVQQLLGTSMYPGAVLYTTADWLDRNRDSARRLAHAIREALEWIAAHSAEEITDKMPDSIIGPDRVTYLEALSKALPMYSRDGRMTAEGAEAVHRLLSASLPEVKKAQIDLASTYTNEAVDEK
jgi:NitT/TauT family transport system substrate-binding protein